MWKRTLALLLSVALLFQPVLARADVLSAFSDLLGSASSSVSAPGQFSTQTRNAFTGGGAEVRFGSKKVTFLSVSPPSYTIGCAGISAYFGGFSFINSQQIAQLLQNISQVAVAFVIKLALKVLCPICEAVLADLTALAAKAAAMSADACKLGEQLANSAYNMFTGKDPKSAAPATCSAVLSASGGADDYGDAAESVCNTIVGVSSWVTNAQNQVNAFLANNQPKDDVTAPIDSNLAWVTLRALGFDAPERRVIMSLTGTVINYTAGTGRTTGCGPAQAGGALAGNCFVPPLVNDIRDMGDLMMCGTNGHNSPHVRVAEYCRARDTNRWSVQGLPFYVCQDDRVDADPEWRCMNPVHTNLVALQAGSKFVSFDGFLGLVYGAIKAGIDAVTANQPLPAQTVKLVNVTPFPIYRLINLAAVYPGAAEELLNANAQVIATVMAQGYLRYLLLSTKSPKAQNIPGEAGIKMGELIQAMAKQAKAEAGNVLEFLTLQERMLHTINSVNRAVQVNVMSQGLLSNHGYAMGVLKSVGR